MQIDFLVFGSTGMQGSIVVKDLVKNGYTVAASGKHVDKLAQLKLQLPSISTYAIDLQSPNLPALVSQIHPKVIVNCAEGDWNLSVFQAALAAGAHVIDLGSEIPMTKDQLELDAAFKLKNIIGVTGIGSTPGITNVMLDFGIKEFESVETIEAGFAWTSNIKTFVVPFSMESIIEEFTDPAVFVENGEWTNRIPMQTIHENTFRDVGPQKVFMVRHPEPFTYYHYYQSTGVKNVRFFAGFPHHSFDVIASFANNSDNRARKVAIVDGQEVPYTQLTNVLNKKYPKPDGYDEKENLWVNIEGIKNGQWHKMLLECIVQTLPEWKEAGCNIDTSLPASILAQMLHKGLITQSGTFAPEGIVPHQIFFHELTKRGMVIWANGQRIY